MNALQSIVGVEKNESETQNSLPLLTGRLSLSFNRCTEVQRKRGVVLKLDGSELPVLRNPRRRRGPSSFVTIAGSSVKRLGRMLLPVPVLFHQKNAVQTERQAAQSTFRVLVSRHAN